LILSKSAMFYKILRPQVSFSCYSFDGVIVKKEPKSGVNLLSLMITPFLTKLDRALLNMS
jgi:hypothetical protein